MTQPQTQTEPSDSSTTPDLLLAQIEQGDIEPYGELFRELLDRVTPLTHGTISTDDVLRMVQNGQFQLWTVFERGADKLTALMVSQLSVFPSGVKACEVIMCAGDGMRTWMPFLLDVEQWARANGCDRMIVNGRRAWGRVLTGFDEQYVVFKKPLGD